MEDTTMDAPAHRMDAMDLDDSDVEDHKDTIDTSHLQFSEKESQLLELYDRLEELLLETSLLKAQSKQDAAASSRPVSEKQLEDAQKRLLESKARYTLKNTIVESVLVANPILKAVHGGLNASPIERDLKPLIEERDRLSVSLTDVSAKVQSAREKLTKVEAEHIVGARKNTELAAEMIALTEESESRKDDIRDPALRAQLQEAEAALKASRQRWRIIKGTVSAVVAGSGVDWARDAALRELVLDSDDD